MPANTKKNEEYWSKEGRRKTDKINWPFVTSNGKLLTDLDEIAKSNWRQGYFDPDHPHRDFLIKLIKTSPPKRVLEIGMGCGANLYRIKKEFPDCIICGCDINSDAIDAAKELFKEAFPAEMFVIKPGETISEIDFRVGNIMAIPFDGELFDLVITDACLIYIGPDKIERAFREIRRVGYDKMLFNEFHSDNWLKRLKLRLMTRYFAYNYFKLLSDNHFKYIIVTKLSPEMFGGEPWTSYGAVMTCIR